MAGLDRPRAFGPATATAVGDGNTTETVVLTLGGINAPAPNPTVVLTGVVNVTIGAASTAITVRVRKGSLTGAVVGAALLQTGAASSTQDIPLAVVDTPGEVGNAAYVVTTQETGAGAAGTVNLASLGALVY